MMAIDRLASAGAASWVAAPFVRTRIACAIAGWLRRLVACLALSLRQHLLFLLAVAAYAGAASVVPTLFRIDATYRLDLYSELFVIVSVAFLAVFGAGYVAHVMLFVRPHRLARHLWHDVTSRALSLERVSTGLPVLLLFPVILSTYTFLKSSIPAIHPFSWDPRLAEWDRILHGGLHPWEWLQPVLGQPYVSAAIAFCYNSWFFVSYGVLLWQTFRTAQPRLRMQYLLTVLLLWALLGNLAATLLSSAGPVYFESVTGLADPFQPLMSYLRAANEAVPILSLPAQDMLWRSYLDNAPGIGHGISAMPSLHLATSFSFVLVGFATSRRLGIAFAVFCALILVGSVHLGWHYAIDGYVAIIATWLIWLAVGWLLDRRAVSRLLWPAETRPPRR